MVLSVVDTVIRLGLLVSYVMKLVSIPVQVMAVVIV